MFIWRRIVNYIIQIYNLRLDNILDLHFIISFPVDLSSACRHLQQERPRDFL